jgi:hypothetical protein
VSTTIKVKSLKTNREVEFEVNFGDTLAESIEAFGEEAVHDIFLSQAVIRAQAAARTVLDERKDNEAPLSEENPPVNSPEDAIAAGQGYKPGEKKTRIPGVSREKAFDLLAKQLAAGNLTIEELVARVQRG